MSQRAETLWRWKILSVLVPGAVPIHIGQGQTSFAMLQRREIVGYGRDKDNKPEITYSPWADVPMEGLL